MKSRNKLIVPVTILVEPGKNDEKEKRIELQFEIEIERAAVSINSQTDAAFACSLEQISSS